MNSEPGLCTVVSSSLLEGFGRWRLGTRTPRVPGFPCLQGRHLGAHQGSGPLSLNGPLGAAVTAPPL